MTECLVRECLMDARVCESGEPVNTVHIIQLSKWLLCVYKSMDEFCYLGDMLSVEGDADAAVEARI